MEIYCFQLGMVTNFSYCILANNGLPCPNIIGCWKERVDIENLLSTYIDEKSLKAIFEGNPKSRLERICEILSSLKKD